MLEVRVLGTIDVRVDGRVVPIGSPTQRLLLAALARDPGATVGRQRLVELVWGDDEPETAGASLKSHLSRLRRLVGSGAVAARGGGYALTIAPEQVDARRFEASATGAATLTELDEALALWRGAPFAEAGEHAFFLGEVTRLAEVHARARARRADLLVAAGRGGEAIAELEGLALDNPRREPLWVSLVEALRAAGRQAEAVAAAHAFRRSLADVGLTPSAAFEEAERRAFDDPAADEVVPARRTPGTPPPRPLVEVVGRDDELAQIAALVGDHRVVTLVGPGGVGKTTLACAAAHADAARREEGPWMAALADVARPDSVVAAVARAVGAPTTAPIDHSLRSYLADRSALLVVDNAEHVHAAARAVVREVATTAPGLRVIVTSRRPLGLPGEVVLDVAPLAPGPALDVFRQRARDGGVPLTADRADQAARVCARLDRLPLALEMAASRLRALGIDEVEAQLDRRAPLVGTAPDTARHATLDAVVQWSYDLLDARHRRLLAELSVFAGRFGVAAARAVAGGSEDGVAGGLADLVDASLLRVDHGGGDGRYLMLATVRRFASERLDAETDAAAVRARFVGHHVAEAEAADAGLRSPDARRWARRFGEQVANLEAAHRTALADRDLDAAARLAAASHEFVYQRLRADVGAWADVTLPELPPDHPAHPGVAAVVGCNRIHSGDLDGAARVLADLPVVAEARRSHLMASDMELYRGDLDAAAAHARTAMDLARRAGDDFTEVFAGMSVAMVEGYRGDGAAALAAVAALRPRAAEVASPVLAAWLDYAEAEFVAPTDPDAAIVLLDRAVSAADAGGWRLLAGVGRLTGASVRARSGDPHAAVPAFRRLVDHWDGIGDGTHQWTTLRNLVELLVRLGRSEVAARLLGACDAAPRPTYGSEQRRLEDAAAQLRRTLGAATCERLVAEGRRCDLAGAVRLARDELDLLDARSSR